MGVVRSGLLVAAVFVCGVVAALVEGLEVLRCRALLRGRGEGKVAGDDMVRGS